ARREAALNHPDTWCASGAGSGAAVGAVGRQAGVGVTAAKVMLPGGAQVSGGGGGGGGGVTVPGVTVPGRRTVAVTLPAGGDGGHADEVVGEGEVGVPVL
ncbi:hypothetical protein LTR53_007408, partial [Teratosphaeriaceae sp. CCFEE 6253]